MPFEVPTSLAGLLSLFRGCFTQPSFQSFCVLSVGLLTRVQSRTVTGMLVASGLAGRWHHSRAHRFFSRARWSVERLGLIALGLVESRFVAVGEPLVIAIDDTLLRRSGPKVFGRHLNYDGSSPAAVRASRRVAFGNSWVVAGAVIELPFLGRPVCLPVLFRLWRPGHGPTQVQLACELVDVAARAHPNRRLIVLADGAYAGEALSPSKLPENVRLVLRARRDIRLHRPAPARRAGQVGRPRMKGQRLASVREVAAQGTRWRRARLRRHSNEDTIELFSQRGVWYPSWAQAPVKVVAVRDRAAADQLEAVIISSDPELEPIQILELYAKRWAIEVAFRDAKQLVGVGEAENRTRQAVERTAPFGFLCLTMAVVWYALAGHDPSDVTERQRRQPWYRSKRQPSVADMLVKLRRTVIAARVSAAIGPHATTQKILQLSDVWETVAS